MTDLTQADIDELAKIGVEPDDVPTKFLGYIAGGLTISVILMVGFSYWFFKHTVAQELAEKGYDVTESASF